MSQEDELFVFLRDNLTEQVLGVEIPPILNKQVVFPTVSPSDLSSEDGLKDAISKQFSIGVCLRAIVGKKVTGIRFANEDNGSTKFMGWVVDIEDEFDQLGNQIITDILNVK